MTPRFTRIAVTALAVAVSLGLAPSAFAVSENGDAGDLPSTSQDLGSGAVTSILGSFTGGGDVDMYRVCLTDGASFSASATNVGSPPLDTQIFLMDGNGLGVYSNDDAAIGVRGSRLPEQPPLLAHRGPACTSSRSARSTTTRGAMRARSSPTSSARASTRTWWCPRPEWARTSRSSAGAARPVARPGCTGSP